MAPVMLPAQMTKADATRAKPVLGMPPGFELFRDSFDVLVRDESPLWADLAFLCLRRAALAAPRLNVGYELFATGRFRARVSCRRVHFRGWCIDPVKICSCYKGEGSDECDDGRQHQAVDCEA